MRIESGNVCFPDWNCVPMVGLVIYLGSAVLVVAAALGALLWDARRTPTPSQAAARANRHATLASLVGVALMVTILIWVLGGVVLGLMPFGGRVVATLPVLAGASLLAAQAVGQLTWPRPSGATREAELAPRTIDDVAPRWSRRLALIWAGTAVALLMAFGTAADGPRSLTRVGGGYSEALGPYPGWYYGIPVGIAVLALVGAGELVLRLITVRPAVVGVSAAWDLELRRRSARHVTRGTQLVLAVTTAGILAVAGRVHQSFGHDWIHLEAGGYASTGSPAQAQLGAALLVSAGCVLLTALAGTILPWRRGRREPPASAETTVPA